MLEEEFDKYANKYDLTNNNLKSKYNHSYRVMKYMVDYATMLGFNEHDIEISKIIGLLHDYGRFEQFTRYNSFIDRDTVDHADLSVEELFDKNEIVNYTDLKDEYDLIKFAIKNHNKLSIEDTDDLRYIKFAKLIRDADKVDIMYVLTNEIIRNGTDDLITKEVIECIKEHKPVPRKIVNNENDRILVDFSFAFDLNYDVCLKDYKNGFIEFYNHLGNKEMFKEYFDEVIKYIDERIDKYVRN